MPINLDTGNDGVNGPNLENTMYKGAGLYMHSDSYKNMMRAGKEAVKAGKSAKDTAKAVAEASGAGPAGIAKLAAEKAVGLFKKTSDKAETMQEASDMDESYKPGKIIIGLIIVLLPLIIIFAMTGLFWKNMSAKITSAFAHSEYGHDITIMDAVSAMYGDPGSTFKAYTRFSNGVEHFIGSISESEETGALKYGITNGICKDFKEILSDQRWTLFRWFDGYDSQKSIEYFRSQPWPYDIQDPNDPVTIGNVMDYMDFNYNYALYITSDPGKEPKFDDLNWAELFCLLSFDEEFFWGTADLSTLTKYCVQKDVRKYFYEADVKWAACYKSNAPTYQYTDTDGNIHYEYDHLEKEYSSEEDAAEHSNAPEGYSFECYYAKTTIMPYGLRELYALAEVMPFDYPGSENGFFFCETYEEQLDDMEYSTRHFVRDNIEMLGPAYDEERSEDSIIYDYLVDVYGEAKGRSAYFYIANPINLNLVDLAYVDPSYVNSAYWNFNLEFPDGTNVLDFTNIYINQYGMPNFKRGDSGDDFNSYGCWDASWMMAYMYYKQTRLTEQEMAYICQNYVNSNGGFKYGQFQSDYGIPAASGEKQIDMKQIKTQIDSGNPVILHVGDVWTYEGKTYHATTAKAHTLLVVGYDEDKQSLIVADPGGKTGTQNTTDGIPYEAFTTLKMGSMQTFG